MRNHNSYCRRLVSGVAAWVWLIAAVNLAAAEERFPPPGQWRVGGQNLMNSRTQPDTAISPQTAAGLHLKWVFTTGGDVSATPAVADGVVYFPDFAGNFFAIDARTGRLIWQHKISDWSGIAQDYARTDPLIDGDLLIIGNHAGSLAAWTGKQLTGDGAQLMAVNARTGEKVWTTQVETFPTAVITGSPIAYDGVVYVGIASAEEGLAATAGVPCCTSRGSLVALDIRHGRKLWQTYMVPEGYSGGGIWGATPVIDPARNAIYVGTGNNYSVPTAVAACFEKNNNDPSCTDPRDYFDAVVALDLSGGRVKWAKRAMFYDAWNVNCVSIVIPPATVLPGPGPNCPIPTGPDYDFGAGPNLIPAVPISNGGRRRHDILGIGEKSGIYRALDPDDGRLLWSTQVGPAGSYGGIEWGTASDGRRIYVPIGNSESLTYALQPSGTAVNGGAWAALDPSTGTLLWQTPTPGHCSPAVALAAQGCTALGPPSIANGVMFAGSMDTDAAAPTMFALDAQSGHILWSFAAGSSVIAGPAITGNSVYWGAGYGSQGPGVGTGNDKLYAFTIDDDNDR